MEQNDDDNDDESMEVNENSNPDIKEKGKKQKSKKRKQNQGNSDDDNSDDDDEVEDDDDDDDDDEDNNRELMRQRILRQKQDEERRRREQEAEQQVLAVSVERFTIPEILFQPSDAGLSLDMAGLPQSIVQSIQACPKYLQPALFRSIKLTGGLSQLPNLVERLQRELRALIPGQYILEMTVSKNPLDEAWLGARELTRKTPYTEWSVTRNEWEAGQKRRAWMKLTTSKGGALV